MSISTRSRYALRALTYISMQGQGKPVPVKEVAEVEKLTVDYLVQLFQILKRAGILRSVRGPKGGYVLVNTPDQISVLQVLQAFDEEVLDDFCAASSLAHCNKTKKCMVKNFWDELRTVVNCRCEECTLQDLISQFGGFYEFKNED